MNKLLLILIVALAIYYLLPGMNVTAQPQGNPATSIDCYAAMQPIAASTWPQMSVQDRAVAAWQLINACEP